MPRSVQSDVARVVRRTAVAGRVTSRTAFLSADPETVGQASDEERPRFTDRLVSIVEVVRDGRPPLLGFQDVR
ncbi:MAG: hypothetical protein ACI91T_002843, partial [Natronomonas sp.]